MTQDRLSTTFAALADPTRRAILARLTLGEATVTELAKPFKMSLPAISKHLQVLERAGLIERGRDAQWRPCRLQADPLKEVVQWLEQYRSFWDQSLDRLGDYLARTARKGEAKWPQEIVQLPKQRSRSSRSVTHHRCAAKPRVQGLDHARALGTLVGPARLHDAVLRDGLPTGWRLSRLHTVARRHRLLDAGRLSRDRRA